MDNSTEGVTLLAAYYNDVLNTIKEYDYDTKPLDDLIRAYDLSNPFASIPIEPYNRACEWVEQTLGAEVTIEVGKKIGARAYDILVENQIVSAEADVIEIMEGLEIAASTTIQDPKGRGWELISPTKNRIVMRRTQTFNSTLQLGLLEGLATRCANVVPGSVTVKYLAQVTKGAEFDEYEVQWEYK